MVKSSILFVFLVTTYLCLLGCKSNQEQKPAFISLGGGFSVSLENVPNSEMEDLLDRFRDKIGDTLQMGYPFLRAKFDKYALFTIHNDSTLPFFIWTHDSLFLYHISMVHERGTSKFDAMEFLEPFSSSIKKTTTRYVLKPNTSRTFYLPYCTTYRARKSGNTRQIAVDILAFSQYYTYDSSDSTNGMYFKLELGIDSLKNAFLKRGKVKKY
ncbi:hypothetical protein QNI16_09105 [Cytophagaceae bacterium YF14B1]|uniref:Uncharacterized protein n=1 Tax=Xanthocytophaga flava TaxID=3048013 RepID=A0AAE3QPB9_9BACT|nr:hypothetical protein [Xanthocytophaga flavus]MDJ1480641.1 hypothetical protein [Xanthocytophaga flavus]